MIATWMLYALALGLLISLAAHALDRGARALGVPTRFIWLGAMIATMSAPVVAYALRRIEANGVAVVSAARIQPAPVDARVGQSLAKPTALSSAVRWIRTRVLTLDRPVALIWAALSLILLGRLSLATWMLWRNRQEWTAREIDGVQLFVTANLGPAVVALPRPRILVPEWLLSLEPEQVALVLRHEREHHLAGDPRLLVAATILTAILPWNAALWWQTRRLRLAVEMDCDARVLRDDPRVDRYGSLLLAIAQHPRAALHGAVTLTESTSDLERRIDVMTRPASRAPRVTAALLGGIAVSAIFAACVMQSPDLIVAPPERTPLTADKALFEFQVEQPATAMPDNMPPRYPEQLRHAGIGGVVVAKFVVDSGGRVDMSTFMVVKADHELFVTAVREAMPDMRFAAAKVGGHPVKQLLQMPFIFSLSSGEVAARKAAAGILTPRRASQPEVRDSGIASVRTGIDRDAPEPKSENIPPRYPAQLRAANIEGQVLARVLVRADGSVDPGTLEILTSDHALFTEAVRNAMQTMHFKPSLDHGDHKVTLPFVFSLSK